MDSGAERMTCVGMREWSPSLPRPSPCRVLLRPLRLASSGVARRGVGLRLAGESQRSTRGSSAYRWHSAMA
eukprot:15188825-Alexandrium_andersonii.AAC.1